MRDIPVVHSFWSSGTSQAYPPLEADLDVDVAVVGAGFAGLASAYRIQAGDPSRSIALLEAEHVGFGASGRCFGVLAPMHPGIMFGTIARSHGPATAAWVAGYLARQLREWLELLAGEGVDCEPRECPVLIAARSAEEVRLLDRCSGHLREAGVGFRVVGADELAVLVPFAGSKAIRLSEGMVRMQPVKLAQGLARVLCSRGVRVFEKTKVAALSAGRHGVVLRTGAGVRLRARKAVLATSVETARLGLGRRNAGVAGAYTYVLATERLDAATLAKLGPALKAGVVTEARVKYAYAGVRDGRLLFGGRSRMPAFSVEGAERDHRSYRALDGDMRRLFPFLDGVAIEAAWGGPIHIGTMGRMPVVKAARGRADVVLNVGYNVDGASLSLVSGKMAAGLALGDAFLDADAERLRRIYLTSRMSVRELLEMAPWLLRG